MLEQVTAFVCSRYQYSIYGRFELLLTRNQSLNNSRFVINKNGKKISRRRFCLSAFGPEIDLPSSRAYLRGRVIPADIVTFLLRKCGSQCYGILLCHYNPPFLDQCSP